jgi:hypothetical protein
MGGVDNTCPETTSAFCGSLRFGECPELTTELEWRAECPLDASEATYEECSGGYVRFTWQIGFENDVTVVFNDEGTLIYGHSSDYDGRICNVGQPRGLTGCRSCTICSVAENSAGGGGEGGYGPEACDIINDGVVGLPE